ncbi:hypothetical protein V6N13_082677 [Hibiscus sabdariffa]|uniref:Uncharacterized protein n=1 Tax=Hibiscus sabdariffa TaxID=183260 RepID=A0ABR2AXL9_9ROSI
MFHDDNNHFNIELSLIGFSKVEALLRHESAMLELWTNLHVIESSYDIDCDFDGDCDNAPKEENKEDDAKEVKSIVYAGGWLLCVALEIYFSLAMWFLL